MTRDQEPTRQLPRPAATVLLLRDAANGPEVLMLKRSPTAAFVANAYVFPGGAVDASDTLALAHVTGLEDQQASARLDLPEGGLAYWVAAVRECFEESGILLAVDAHGAPVSAERAASLGVHRAAVNAGTLRFGALLEQEQLFIDAHSLAYFAHWITAPGRPRRFTTRFFVAHAPVGQLGSHDASETVDSRWISAQDALAACARNEIELVHPTRVSLEEIAPFERAEQIIHFARDRTDIVTNKPCWGVGREGKKLFRRGMPAYAEIHWCDPQEHGNTSYELIAGVPKTLDAYVTRLIAPNPGFMTGPGTNTYLVGTDAIAVIDPGPDLDAHVEAILAAGAGRIRWILCTHTHLDHSPAARRIKAATGASIYGRPAPDGRNQDPAFAPDHVLQHDARLPIGPLTLRAIHTPGHASNHLCYLLENTQMLFTGDHVMQGSTVVINPPDGDMIAYLASLEMLTQLSVTVFAPGHGYLIGEPHREAQRLIAHRLAREAKVIAAMQRLGPVDSDTLVAAVYDDVPAKVHPVALRSLHGHLGKLCVEQRVRGDANRWEWIPSHAEKH